MRSHPEPTLPPAGETFLPYYTGRAIDSIVIQKSMDQFSTAVVVVCLLAIGR
jgi:ATP-binding cassette subfamily B (MDR/TAP) protein 9